MPLHLYKAYDSSYTIKLCYEVRYSNTNFINSIDFLQIKRALKYG